MVAGEGHGDGGFGDRFFAAGFDLGLEVEGEIAEIEEFAGEGKFEEAVFGDYFCE